MKPNDMPRVCLRLRLCDTDIASLLQFLYDLTEALERHYTDELIRRNYPPQDSTEDSPDTDPTADPPF